MGGSRERSGGRREGGREGEKERKRERERGRGEGEEGEGKGGGRRRGGEGGGGEGRKSEVWQAVGLRPGGGWGWRRDYELAEPRSQKRKRVQAGRTGRGLGLQVASKWERGRGTDQGVSAGTGRKWNLS